MALDRLLKVWLHRNLEQVKILKLLYFIIINFFDKFYDKHSCTIG